MKLSLLILFIIIYNSFFSQVSRRMDQSLNSTHYFIENKGQWNDEVLFKSSFKGGNLWVQKTKLFFHLKDFSALHENHLINKCDTCTNKQYALHVNFKNCNQITKIEKYIPSVEYFNFFIGNNKQNWVSDVHGYKEVILNEIYNGINLKLVQNDEVTKYEYIIKPNTSLNQISLEISGAKSIEISRNGELIIKTPLGNIQENKPYAYQIINNKEIQIPCDFIVKDSLVSYKVGNYDENYELIIDPVLVFATYSGSVTDNFGMTATYGHDGTSYSGGTIFGNSYPTPDKGVYNPISNFTIANGNGLCSDVFISKYSSDGKQMIWTNFIGGGSDYSGAETVHSLICDKNNNLFAFGATSSNDFPVSNSCYQNQHHGGTYFAASQNGALFGNYGVDMFVFNLSNDGKNLLASTYLGGSGNDGVNSNIYGITNSYNDEIYYDSLTVNYGDQFRGEIMLDSLNNVYIASSSRSNDFPIVSPIQSLNRGQQDGVIVKLDRTLTNLLFSTYIGGSNNDALYSIKLDSSYNIVFCGGTSSSDIQTSTNVYQNTFGGGKSDGLVGKIRQTNNSLKSLTYLGMNDFDQMYIVESDENDDVYLIGHSLGGKFPLVNYTYSIPNSTQYIIKLNDSLSKIKQSTCYGSGNPMKRDISPTAMLVDLCKNIYISGWGANVIQNTEKLTNMPVSSDALISSPPNGFDFHLFSIDNQFSKIIYGTYLGGKRSQEHVDGGTSRFDKNGVVYQSICGGCGGNSDFPTSIDAYSRVNKSSNCNNIVLKFDFEIKAIPSLKVVDTSCVNTPIQLTNESKAYSTFYWKIDNDSISDGNNLTYFKKFTDLGLHQIELFVKNKNCNFYEKLTKTVNILPNQIDYLKLIDVEICKKDNVIFNTKLFGTTKYIDWYSDKNLNNLILSDSLVYRGSFNSDSIIYIKLSDDYCFKIDSAKVKFINHYFNLNGENDLCENDEQELVLTNPKNISILNLDWNGNDFYDSINAFKIKVKPKNEFSKYYVQVMTFDSCVFNDTFSIHLHKPLYNFIDAKVSSDSIFKGEHLVLEAYPNNLEYKWLLSNNIISNKNPINVVPEKSQFYNVVGSDGYCLYSDSVYIKVISGWECDFPYIYVPNAFSPNNDNQNDILYVRGRTAYTIEFRVFNRWGENVFYSNDISNGWDGTYKGQKLPPDVYDYYLIVQCVNGEKKQLQGNITLLK